jgi:pimeloyl-ACP methyl ester carboxylesterase
MSILRRSLICVLLVTAPGCTTFRFARRPAVPPEKVDVAIFVADGAGNFKACSKSLAEVVHKDKLPIYVHPFEWSHGYGRIFADQLGFEHAQAAGAALASQIAEFHTRYPHCRIFVMGHSAGATVALAAVEETPAGTIERCFLIGPSVSASYDLRPALTKVRHAVHVFYSEHDWWYLGLATQVVGTQDRQWLEAASGRVGFRFQPDNLDEQALEKKLRQHPWRPRDADTGNLGGHYGGYQPNFLRRNVLPFTQPQAKDDFEPVEITPPGAVSLGDPVLP